MIEISHNLVGRFPTIRPSHGWCKARARHRVEASQVTRTTDSSGQLVDFSGSTPREHPENPPPGSNHYLSHLHTLSRWTNDSRTVPTAHEMMTMM